MNGTGGRNGGSGGRNGGSGGNSAGTGGHNAGTGGTSHMQNDGGMDAGRDAAMDAGDDAAMDAGHDAATDAGHDASSDAAPSGPTIGITGPDSVDEGDTTSPTVMFTVTLSAAQSSQVKVDYTTRDGSAKAFGLPWGYTYASDTLIFSAGQTQKTFSVTVVADAFVEGDKDFYVDLSNAIGGPTLDPDHTSAKVTIVDDDDPMPPAYPQPILNDTGITQCSDATSVGLSCPQASYAGQDATYGRDNSAPAKTGTGPAGFDFTKLGSTGAAIANQSDDYATTPWSCVQDNVTGLVWEVKTTSGLHNRDCLVFWWDGHTTSAGDQGSVSATCGGIRNDTYSFVRAVNGEALCGFTDWRLPTVEELRTISDYSAGTYGDGIWNLSYFPNTKPNYHWTSDLTGNTPWLFAGGYSSNSTPGTYSNYVRLVRGGTTSSGARFTDNNDGTITDGRTHLMWKRCSEGQSWDDTGKACTGSPAALSWQTALSTAEAASFAGKSDWRLPNIKELASILDRSHSYSAPSSTYAYVDTGMFSIAGGVSIPYWSGSPGHEPGVTGAEIWRMDLASASEYYAGGNAYALLVRDAP
jgi:hypothetical protein